MECLTYCIANTIDLNRLDHHFKTSLPGYNSVRSHDVLKLSRSDRSKPLVFVFKNGTVVFWGLKRYQVKTYLDTIIIFAEKPVSFLVHDEFSYQIGSKTTIEPHGYFDVDCLTMDEDSEDLKLSFSYGFSQSVKLQYFETILEALIEKYNPMIQSLANRGQMPISRNQIRQVIGEILGSKSEMNLISNFLYHPKYFWRHPSLAEYYAMMERYLHIQRRVNAINHRLDTLNEIFDMFHGYLEARHSHSLEIIIIALIVIEVAFDVLNFIV